MVAQTITIRACEDQDLRQFDRVGGPQHVQYCRAQFARGPHILAILVAVDGNEVLIGKLHLDFEERAGDGEAVLLAGSVAADHRSRGIGTELMLQAETVALERGFHAIVLGVEDANPRARALYERLGYVAFSTHDDFRYEGAPVPNPGVWMRKELSP